MKGTKHRVLFQNAPGSINLGLCFSTNIDQYDLFWFSIVAKQMENALERDEDLISVDDRLKIKSGYVELHRQAIEN